MRDLLSAMMSTHSDAQTAGPIGLLNTLTERVKTWYLSARNNERGIPEIPQTVLVDSVWREGATVKRRGAAWVPRFLPGEVEREHSGATAAEE